jgi:hypothetical protein
MGYKMKGWSGNQSSPAKQVQGKILTPKSKKRSSEHEAVSVYKGTDKSEKIADLEDRIEFIKEDIFNSDEATPEQKKNLASLERELSIIRKTGK